MFPDHIWIVIYKHAENRWEYALFVFEKAIDDNFCDTPNLEMTSINDLE